jgi:hypothetical protein
MNGDGYVYRKDTYYVAKLNDEYLHIDPHANQHTQGPAWFWSGLVGAHKVNPDYFNEESNPYKRMWDSMDLSEAETVRVVEVYEIWEEEE